MREENRCFNEDELLPLSALQHLMFCERQCALIHLEQVWVDNPLTLEGTHMHRRTDGDAPQRERRGDRVLVRALPIRSFHLGVSGRADAVEFHRTDLVADDSDRGEPLPRAGPLPDLPGLWSPFPIEYKRGKPKRNRCDEVQLCAQAMCLEEMLGIRVADGALFYGAIQRRHDVHLGSDLRAGTERAAERLHALIAGGVSPTAKLEAKCRRCSLVEVCLPAATGSKRSARAWFAKAIAAAACEEAESL